MSLPEPAPGRFRPLRCGLVELFLYEAQEFPFRDGRLLLRGDNGSGKSKVLALTLPLLLDANLAAARMEPDADPKKQMAWNLLMGDEHDERTGYSWVEFGRIDEEGTAQFVTLGLGIKAVQHRGVVRQWWFVTDQRVGGELHLVDRLRTVRTRERLVEALGDRGTVFDTAERYRRAVDERLFGLHARYEALVDLLVHLRQPQLSKRPDEQHLNRALTEALPPVRDALIDVVAQSYQSLEEEERSLASLRAGAEAVRTFTAEYVRYARDATVRATLGPRHAQSDYEGQRRRLHAGEEQLAEATTRRETAAVAVTEAEQAVSRFEAERETLRERRGSDELVQLDTARSLADQTRTVRDDAAAAESAAGRRHAEAEATLADARAELAGAQQSTQESAAALRTVGDAAGIAIGELEHVDSDALERTVTTEAERRTRHLDDLRARVAERERATSVRIDAERALDRAAAALGAEDERMRQAQARAKATGESWLESAREALTSAAELRGDGLEEALAAAVDWVGAPNGKGPVAQWVAHVQAARSAALAEEAAAVDADIARLDSELTEVDRERARLEAGEIRRPDAPRTRTADRAGRTGAAFWECVDVRPGLADEDAAGIEAALEASGLLDAWVDTRGIVESVDGDTLLCAAPLEGRTLADALVATPAGGIDAPTIDALLRSVALADSPHAGSVAVSARGSFALGPLTGSWHKPATEYLGATARERARLERLEVLRREREALETARAAGSERRAGIRARIAQLAAEVAAIPLDAPLRTAVELAAAAAERRAHAADEERQRGTALEVAAQAQEAAAHSVTEAARDYQLDVDRLDDVRDALRELPGVLRDLRRAVAAQAAASARLTAGESALERAADELRAATARTSAAADAAVRAAQRLETLEATVGVEAREIEERLVEAEKQLGQARELLTSQRDELQAASSARAVAESKLSDARDAVAAASETRDAATAQFRDFASTGLPALADPEIELPSLESPWLPDPTVRLARRFADTLGAEPTPDAWDRSAERLLRAFETLQAALSLQGHQAIRDVQHEVTVVTVQHGPARVAPDVLAAELDAELADRERLLTERERAILETHLIDEVGAELQTRVQEAMQQVDRMNTELERRPTRSGLRLRIRWESVDEDLDRAGRRLLQQSAAAWSADDRVAIGDFLRERIALARVADPDGSWYDRLAEAFDYRGWNRFSVQLHQNGKWRPASGPASGGERVLAASVPLFAAAASHYASAANPHAPRLILLDEAFAGVDDRSRANYLGLLAEFDLDVVMTSEREWATYPEVPGIAIAQLFRLPGANAVHVEHWTWDGVARERMPDPGLTAIEAPREQAPDETMLALDFGEGQ